MDDDHADDADDEEDVADMEVTVEVPDEADQSEVSMESPVAETMEEEESHIIHVSNDGRIMVKTRVTKSAKVSAKESPKKSPKESPEEVGPLIVNSLRPRCAGWCGDLLCLLWFDTISSSFNSLRPGDAI